VFIGVGAALILATAGGVAAYETIRSYDGSRVQTIFETVTFLVAATVLTYMTFWMRKHARSLSKELRARADAALDGRARWGLGLLAFQAVGREGLETVVFTLAIIFSTSTVGALSGAAIGLAGALAIAFVIYRLGHRLNLARFFTVIGILLMVFAAGLLADSVENLQQLGWLPVLDSPMWHSARLLSENSALGDVLHSFFGYSDAPTPLQLLVYVAYLGVAAAAYLGLRARPRTPADRPHPAAQRPAAE
jgi:high-affinity iron transporter